MTKLSVKFWDEEMEYRLFTADRQPDFNDYLDINWEELVQENELEKASCFAWSIRSILWPELVSRNELEVRFTHDGSLGTGYGPLIVVGDTGKFRELPTKLLQSIDSAVILECDLFSDSDMFMGDYFDGLGFLGIQSLQLEFLSYEVIEANDDEDDESFEVFYENTFSADFRITDKQLHGIRWAEIGDSRQSQILNGLIEYSFGQLREHGEYVHEVTDLFAAILIHDSTYPKARQELLSNLEKLKLNELAVIRK